MNKLEEREERRKSTIGKVSRGIPVRETKKRYCLSLKPSLYEKVKKVAYVERRSTSQVIDELMEMFLEGHKDELDRYEYEVGYKNK